MARKLVALIARHGSTLLNVENLFRSRMDPPLDKKGLTSAEMIAKYVNDHYSVRKIVSSPMLRAVQTADIVAEKCGAKVSQDRGLISWNLGFLSGKDKKTYADVLEYFIDNPKEAVPEGESLDDLEGRTEEFFKDELARDPQEEASGTPYSGYAEAGPYSCRHCIHKPAETSPYCNHSKVVNDPKKKSQLVKIGGESVVPINLEKGCCEYVKPKKEAETVRLYVTHTSNIIALENLFHGNRDGRPETGEDTVCPGGLAEIWEEGGEYDVVPVIGGEDAKFGE